MARAHARHILVPEEQRCRELKERIENGEDFATIAHKYSHCPSGHNGGDLGEFSQGQMAPAFDDVVFSGELNKIYGPVRTQFGYHLIEVLSRTEGEGSKVAGFWTGVRRRWHAGVQAIFGMRR